VCPVECEHPKNQEFNDYGSGEVACLFCGRVLRMMLQTPSGDILEVDELVSSQLYMLSQEYFTLNSKEFTKMVTWK
jgi:hypothetical protein